MNLPDYDPKAPRHLGVDLAVPGADQAVEVSYDRRLRPAEDWHDDWGTVLWWVVPVQEPPYLGSPLDTDWPSPTAPFQPCFTHWSPLPQVFLDGVCVSHAPDYRPPA